MESLASLCTIEYFQSSGPGGQKRNRTYSAVRFKIKLQNEMYFQAEATDHREVELNRKEALMRLRLEIALKCSHPEPDDLQKGSHFRIKASENHFDFPLTVFLILNALQKENGSLKDTAERFSVSTSALVTFLRRNKKVRDRALEILKRNGKKAFY